MAMSRLAQTRVAPAMPGLPQWMAANRSAATPWAGHGPMPWTRRWNR